MISLLHTSSIHIAVHHTVLEVKTPPKPTKIKPLERKKHHSTFQKQIIKSVASVERLNKVSVQ